MKVLVAQSCLTLCDPVDCSPPGSFAHGIPQARILEWVAISSYRRSSQLRDQTTGKEQVQLRLLMGVWVCRLLIKEMNEGKRVKPLFFPPIMLSLCIYFNFWLLWVLTAVRGLSLVGANEGYSLTEGLGLLIGVPSVTLGSAAAACPLRCPVAGGILIPGQGLNPSPLHRKVDS